MSFSAKNYDFKGETCIELIAGDFRALIAPFNGSNVMKLENTALNIDILRNDLSLSPEELKAALEEAVAAKKPCLINAMIDPDAGVESGRIKSLNIVSKVGKK